MTQGGDDYTHSDDDDPRAPPKRTNGKGNGKSTKKRPALHVAGPHDEPLWRRDLATSDKGLRNTATNVALILDNSGWGRAVRHDGFADTVGVGEQPFLPKAGRASTFPPPPPGDLDDEHVMYCQQWLAQKENFLFSEETVTAGLITLAKRHSFNPLTDYLIGCADAWDGKQRVAMWLCDHMGVEHTEYARRVTSMWMISAVARAFERGVQADSMIVLQGGQGLGKTSALQILFGKNWFLPAVPSLSDKDAMHLLVGAWGVNVDELVTMRGSQNQQIANSFFTRRVDKYRPPYGKFTATRERGCIFAATTNSPLFLSDEEGNRRYWPVACTKLLNQDRLRNERDQLWGEAVVRYRAKEPWHPNEDEKRMILRESGQRFDEDTWSETLDPLLDSGGPITLKDCWRALGIETGKQTRADQKRITSHLRHRRWVPHPPNIVDGVQARRWYPPKEDT